MSRGQIGIDKYSVEIIKELGYKPKLSKENTLLFVNTKTKEKIAGKLYDVADGEETIVYTSKDKSFKLMITRTSYNVTVYINNNGTAVEITTALATSTKGGSNVSFKYNVNTGDEIKVVAINFDIPTSMGLRPNINVSNGTWEVMRLMQKDNLAHCKCYGVLNGEYDIPARQFTVENYEYVIKNQLINYNNGICWSGHNYDVIKPGLRLCIGDFLNRWYEVSATLIKVCKRNLAVLRRMVPKTAEEREETGRNIQLLSRREVCLTFARTKYEEANFINSEVQKTDGESGVKK